MLYSTLANSECRKNIFHHFLMYFYVFFCYYQIKNIFRHCFVDFGSVDNLIDFKLWREKRNLSRKQLATMAHISENYLYEIEAGRKLPSLKVLFRIADVLNIYICAIDMLENNTEDSQLHNPYVQEAKK